MDSAYLEALRAAKTPRPPALCRRGALVLESIPGFIGYGVLWLFASSVIAILALRAALLLTRDSLPSPLASAFVYGAWCSSFIAMWVIFAGWVRRRLAKPRRLFREGTFADAQVLGVTSHRFRRHRYTTALLRFEEDGIEQPIKLHIGGDCPPDLVEGAMLPLLFIAGYDRRVVFLEAGKMVASIP